MQETVLADPLAISAERLMETGEEAVAGLVRRETLPLQSERARLLREVGPLIDIMAPL